MSKQILIIVVALTLITLTLAFSNERPVIGILTTPASDIPSIYSPENYSYIPYSYVQSVEAAGARVIPIPYDASPENITFLLKQVNGVLFTGGGAALNSSDPKTGKIGPSNMTAVGEFIISKVIEANDNGIYLPLMGTCQGFEILILAISKDYNILATNYNDFRVSTNVTLWPAAFKSGPWSTMLPRIRNASQNQPFFLYNHYNALTIERFNNSKNLTDFLEITGISKPVLTNGAPFVASTQAKKYPIWGHQFHPEKNAFMWNFAANASHTPDSILATQHITNFFVNEARKNNNTFVSEEVLKTSLIWGWKPVKSLDLTFIFPKVNEHPDSYPNLFPSNLIYGHCVGAGCTYE